MRPAALAVATDDRSTRAEIDLGLLARAALQASKRQGAALPQAVDETADAEVAAGVVVLAGEVLEDALGTQTLLELAKDDGPPGRTVAAPARTRRNRCIGSRRSLFRSVRADGRIGWFWLVRNRFGADGRIGWFCLGERGRGADGRIGWFCGDALRLQMAADGLSVNVQFAGDAPVRPAALVQGEDEIDGSHAEVIRHDSSPGLGVPSL